MFGNDKLKKFVTNLCFVLELIAAIFVFTGIIITLIGLVPTIEQYWFARTEAVAFSDFLENVLAVVIGIEFLKMLCRPNSDNILETIIFVVARHMIINTATTPLDDLISTIAIILLCIMRRYLKIAKEKDKRHKFDDKNAVESIKEIVKE
ncbi:MAG: hypothetical protein K6B67_06090 [Lachnospiraceae bacterium]|nr:hypothetical protein [Lachnospiraceae bacterium]